MGSQTIIKVTLETGVIRTVKLSQDILVSLNMVRDLLAL